MTQRIFDIENEKDYADLWDILPDEIEKIRKATQPYALDVLCVKDGGLFTSLIKINWHNKTEITRPIQEASERDIGKLCCFWNDTNKDYGILSVIANSPLECNFGLKTDVLDTVYYPHCRRLTKQEIEELC